IAAVVILSLLNMMGVVLGKLAQNLLTVVKVLGLGAVVVVAFVYTPAKHRHDLVQGHVAQASDQKLVVERLDGGPNQTFQLAQKATITVEGNRERKDEQGKVQPYTLEDLARPENKEKVVRVFFRTEKPDEAVEIKLQPPSHWTQLVGVM